MSTIAHQRTSIHADLLQKTSPDWLVDATPERRAAMKETSARPPDWYWYASYRQQRALRESFKDSFTAQTQLDKTMSTLQDIDTFAAPILSKALKDRFGVDVDVSKTLLCLRRPLDVGVFEIELTTFEVMKLSLLQAALHNFEASECEDGAFHRESGFVLETSTPGTFEGITVNMTVRAFLSLCRALDLGAQYQTYVQGFFQPEDAQKEATLRQQFIASQKAALKAAAELALMKKDIEPDDYTMILSVVGGEIHPRLGDRQVWFRDLSLMKRRMIGCVVFSISEKYRYTSDFIVYVPHDPEHPLKRYTTAQWREEFKRQFMARDSSTSDVAGPTAHQRFFSQFVAYADRPYYFGQFTRKAADSPSDPLRSIWVKVAQLIPPTSTIARIKELPPEPQARREPVEDPYLDPFGIVREEGGLWSDNTDLWTYLFEQNRAKVIADARSHAVPTADVDAKVRAQKLNHLLEIGMLGLNMVSMFVPVLGEIMITVMAGQLLYESFEGAIEWSEGDREAAKAHLVDVAENLALIGVMAGVGKGLGKLTAVKPEPVVECLEPVTLPNGQTRLWKPDLSGYERKVVLGSHSGPDASGHYRLNRRTFIRQAGKVYETRFDESLQKWRIRHPTDRTAYEPILEHNGHGAWRHTLERPLTWDRLTLLRRMGHVTETLTDDQLLKIADFSSISDNALRKMHRDHLSPPPDLAAALRLFGVDPGAVQANDLTSRDSLIGRLQRACPGLDQSTARRVLLDANPEELTRLKTTRRIPLRMLEEARWYAQQRRVSQAFAGLHLPSAVSADSKWLALHTLEKLSGWSDDVRLEVRDGHINGPLIDSIGSETAANRKYVVKKGPAYQAFDERGEALNGIPPSGDNFIASIMHALPDQARQALGVPHVSQSDALQKIIVDAANEHRAQLASMLEQRKGNSKAFKPPVRVTERTVGYYASGRGQGINPSLVTRVRDVYPQLTDQQANGFILKQLREGKTDAQIFSHLQRRLREWQQLESTLDQWSGAPVSESVLQSMPGGKATAARNIKQAWRNAPLAEDQPLLRSLEVVCDDPLPALAADFSHVDGLLLWGRCVTDANIDGLLGKFPKLKRLRINSTSDQLTNVPKALSAMPDLTGLSLSSAVPYAVDMPSRLSALTSLEELSVYSSGYAPLQLDVSRMRNLRELKVLAPSLYEWPTGVLELPKLERLDLRSTGIRTLPDGVFEGHEKLWSGLSLDWSNFVRENFKPAYEYVKSHPEHLIDREEMVRDYCKGELKRLADGMQESVGLYNNFIEQWQGADARFTAVDALSEQYRKLDSQLNEWVSRTMQQNMDIKEVTGRSWSATFIRTNWRHGVFKRYGSTADPSVLELPKVQFKEFPQLPAGAFDHVKTLYLKGLQAPAEQFRGFIRGFTELHTLDLSANALTDVPIAPGDLANLTRLDLSGNRIVVGPEVQQALDGLRAVEALDLSDNPLNSLDVSGMTRLKALNLRGTELHAWPTGVQELSQMAWLDLRGSKISSLPPGLADDMLLKSQLTGIPLTAQAMEALKTARQRIEVAKVLPAGTLERFDLEDVPATFPWTQSSFSIARHLLPLPEVPVGDGIVHFAERLQRLNPALADDEALQAIEQMRTNGATDAQLIERFAQWDQTFEDLTRRLNGWLYTRESGGAGWKISAESRRSAALRILGCWRDGLTGTRGSVGETLNLNGLQLGDLPELPAVFAHVDTLNLTGVRLSAQGSNDFLRAFSQVKALKLNGNQLQALPEQIQNMGDLAQLELSANRFSDPEHLYVSLNRLERLEWLDLGHNALDSFDVGVFERLEKLDLRNNNLTEWPQGVLDASHLHTLNLSTNDITSIPAEVFDGNHEALISGTDLSENYNLGLESLEQIRDYREAGAHQTVMGLSRTDLDEMIADASGEGEGVSESESFESDESLPEEQPDFEQSALWLANATPQELAGKRQVWSQLAAEPDNAAFFHLLSRLQDTQEFRVANADLTRRVWTVMDAAASNSELREVLFASSNTHGTCVDGRILTFSGLESKVFTHNALLDIPAGRLALKGEALLKLSRQLFRLDKVDDLATKAAARSGRDEAEVRLGYRIGLTDGWSDGLELPGQPKHMTYASGVTPGQLAGARIEVISAEQSDSFFEDLIQRDYWVQYLKEKYPEEFRRLDEAEMSEEADDTDEAALLNRLFDLAAARNSKMVELSRKEVSDINPSR
ncbi:NEL-type E3 ubiquitin ligase domain-containing protein [Pseudomonas laurylsulfatiphila]|uniref:NEL-type E3 ubiquitin ligase domain-containing protein n=1 Tax=Pseudomonas laurylsulfatiphila TaxID=2011015 RepID=UPI003D1E97BC